MDVQLNSATVTDGNVVAAQESATVANTVAAASSGKTVAPVLGGPSLTVTESDMIDEYFEPLKNTAKNMASSPEERATKKRREEEVVEEEREEERLRAAQLEKELDAARAAQETPLV